MSDKMTPIPFKNLIEWVLKEKKSKGKVFGIRKAYEGHKDKVLEIFRYHCYK